MQLPEIRRGCVKSLLENRFMKVFDLQYKEGAHYYVASRRPAGRLACVQTEEDFKSMLPDAVTCYVILKTPGEEDKLLLQYEYRYPIGRLQLSPPAGLIDEADKAEADPLFSCAKREIFEETGLQVGPDDRIYVINPLVFSTPGFTDECNALVGVEMRLPDLSALTAANAEGTELFAGFYPVTKAEARRLLADGVDPLGHYYPLYTYAALLYFANKED